MLKFLDVFFGKKIYFQYFSMFSRGIILDAKISQYFLWEKYLFPIFFDVFLQKNTSFKYFSMFSRGIIPDAKISQYFLWEKYQFQIFFGVFSRKKCLMLKFFNVFSEKNTYFQYLSRDCPKNCVNKNIRYFFKLQNCETKN